MGKLRQRQIIQRYTKERQRNILAKPGPNDFVVILDGLKPGFNVAKTFRSADAFGASAVHLVDIGVFDPAPAKGSFRKVPAIFHETFSDCFATLSALGYIFFILTPEKGRPLHQTKLPKRCAFIFGHEEFGHSFDPNDYPDIRALTIPQFGSVQSLNVSIAASIVMFEHVRQHPENTGEVF